jgi:hypothetical protein
MRIATTVAQMLVRALGLVQLALGGLFWTGNQLQLIPLHMMSGMLLVVGLWVLAGLGAAARVGIRRVLLAFAWGIGTIAFGLNQATIVPGDLHWTIQVLHLLVGIAAIAQAESLARAIKERRS